MKVHHHLAQFLLLLITLLSSWVLIAAEIADPGAEQKAAIGHMHHVLHEAQAPYKTQEAAALKAVNELTVQEGVDLADINAKIGELMAAKTQILRLRYAHLVEMRAILSDEQKVKYDKGVLSRSAVK